jgi:hypothetical protein
LRIFNPRRGARFLILRAPGPERIIAGMRPLLLLAIGAISAGASAPSARVPLQALTEADVGADALTNAACYLHDGPAVLLVAAKKNAVVNHDGDLLLLQRAGDSGFPSGGARYTGTEFEVVVTPAEDSSATTQGGRTDRAAQVSVRASGNRASMAARWSCGYPS